MDELRGLWRGKRIDGSGAWVEGLLEYRDYELSSAQLYNENDCEDFWVDPSTLGECTGLRDKNGKLIFEGDIIEHNGERYVIKYLEKYMRFSPTKPGTVFSVFDYTQSEVIDNIHDNPELLNDRHKESGNDQERAAR